MKTISANGEGNSFKISLSSIKDAYQNQDIDNEDVRLLNIYGDSKELDEETHEPLYKVLWSGDSEKGDPTIWHFDDKDVEITSQRGYISEAAEGETRIYVNEGETIPIQAKNDHLSSLSVTVKPISAISGNRVDGTVPSLAVSGLRKGGTYEGSTHKVRFDAKDNISLKKVAVYVDGEEFASYDTDTLKDSDGKEKFVLTESSEPQDIELRATDQAGNMLIKRYKNVVVTADADLIRDRRNTSDIIGNAIDVISQKKEDGDRVVNMVYIALGAVLLLLMILAAALLYRKVRYTVQE